MSGHGNYPAYNQSRAPPPLQQQQPPGKPQQQQAHHPMMGPPMPHQNGAYQNGFSQQIPQMGHMRPPMPNQHQPGGQMAPPQMMGQVNGQMRPPNSMGQMAPPQPQPQMSHAPPPMSIAQPTPPRMNSMAPPPTSIGQPQMNSMAPPPTSIGQLQPPRMNSMPPPPTSIGQPQMNHMMPPPTSIGQPPRGPMSSMNPPMGQMAPPPTQIGQMHAPMGQQPAQMASTPATSAHQMNQPISQMNMMASQMSQMNVTERPFDLMNGREVLIGPEPYQPRPIKYQNVAPPGVSRIPPDRRNCDRGVMACTMNAIPSSDSICQKSKLPLGLILHPYKDLATLPVITTSNIVRCRGCRSYINPFVNFIDTSRWKCNLCGRINDVPEEFKSNPVNKEYGRPECRPECLNSTVEFIAPAEYMSRPPQAAQYLFVLDVSYNAVQSGYLSIFADELINEYKSLPGDKRTKIGFICFDSSIHFFNLAAENHQPQQITVSDVDDPFEPCPDGLMVNREECLEQIEQFLAQLPIIFGKTSETSSCAGSAISIGQTLMAKNGGRVTVFSTARVNTGLGKLEERQHEKGKKAEMLNAKTDFYKTMALDANQHHVSIDLFLMGHQFQDVASLGPLSRNSAGACYRYPGLHQNSNALECDKLRADLHRYFTRKIGFEAVMRVRATRGISIHTFYGNFFVRSTDLLNLACVSPDLGYAMRLQIDDDLKGIDYVAFQCALLYTSQKGDRRIRVHTMSLPVTSIVNEIHQNADAEMVASMLAHMAVDRSMSHSPNDAREALTHAACDAIKSFTESLPSHQRPQGGGQAMMLPSNMKQFPLLISALLKSEAFRTNFVEPDTRSFLLHDIKQQPAQFSKQHWHPDLYRVDNIEEYPTQQKNDLTVPRVSLLPLSAQYLAKEHVFILDIGWTLLMLITVHAPRCFFTDVLGVESFGVLQDGGVFEVPDEPDSEDEDQSDEPLSRNRFRSFIISLQEDRPHAAPLQIIRDDGRSKPKFITRLVQDRTDSQMSYFEFLTHLQKLMK